MSCRKWLENLEVFFLGVKYRLLRGGIGVKRGLIVFKPVHEIYEKQYVSKLSLMDNFGMLPFVFIKFFFYHL